MLSKISLVASALGLVVVGTGTAPIVPAHITQTNITAAYTFDSVEACRSKLHGLYAKQPELIGKLACRSND